MSKINDLKEELVKKVDSIDTQKLNEQVRYTRYLHDRVIPMINEVVMSASGKKSYEEAYKSVIDKLRSVHEKVAKEKQDAERSLMMALGQKQLVDDIMPYIEDADQEYNILKEKQNEKKIEKIAESIKSGSYDPDAPRKIGTRPESIKNIRSAKATLFGQSIQKDKED